MCTELERLALIRATLEAGKKECQWMLDQLYDDAPGRSHIIVIQRRLDALSPQTILDAVKDKHE